MGGRPRGWAAATRLSWRAAPGAVSGRAHSLPTEVEDLLNPVIFGQFSVFPRPRPGFPFFLSSPPDGEKKVAFFVVEGIVMAKD